MLGIVLHHSIVHSEALDYLTGVNRIYAYFIVSFGKIGVDIFVSITSFYLSDKETTTKQFFRVYTQTFIFYIVLLIPALFLYWGRLSIKKIAAQFLPIIGHENWYVSNFLLFLLLIPILNITLRQIRNNHLLPLYILGILFFTSIISTFGITYFSVDIIHFVLIYLIVVYLKFNGMIEKLTQRCLLCITILSLSTIVVSELIMKRETSLALSTNSFFALCCGVSLFVFFLKKVNISYSKTINFLGKTTFSVFLIHTANLFRHDYLWQVIFKCNKFFVSQYFIPWTIVCSIILFVAGVVSYLIYKPIGEYVTNRRYLKKMIEFIDQKMHDWISST